MTNAIEIRDVCKRYGEFELNHVNLSLPSGCVLGLVGENGAGKSTLLRLILGACCPDSGEVFTLGRKADRSAAFADVRQDIGVVLDDACLPGGLRAERLGKVLSGLYRGWDADAFAGYVKRLGIPEKKEIQQYSRGTRMKLAIAAALSHNARLLVLDEATGGLDPIVRDEILDMLNDFTRDESHAILISSHIVSDLEKICDYIAFLHDGRLMFFEEKDALSERFAVFICSEEDYARLRSVQASAILRAMRAHGAVRALVDRERLRGDTGNAILERASIEDIMLLLTKGEEIR